MESIEVSVHEGKDPITDVQVDKSKQVLLCDEGVFKLGQMSVILKFDKPSGSPAKVATQVDDDESVDCHWSIHHVEGRHLIVGFVVSLPEAEDVLDQDDDSYVETDNGDSDQQLIRVGVGWIDAPLGLSLLIDLGGADEVRVFRVSFWGVSHMPVTGEHILLPLPTLNEQSSPNDQDEGIQSVPLRIESGIEAITLLPGGKHDYGQNDSNNGWNHQPACVMDNPAEVECNLFSIVVPNVVHWEHVLLKIVGNHANREP